MKKTVLVLLGPTATGKTEISIYLAKLLKTEIISADSMQIYKFMDIGTAKPTLEQRKNVLHHMIDIVNPWDYFSTGDYIEKVKNVIEKLLAEDKIPLIVGGTGLYLRALTTGIFEATDADWSLRRRLNEIEKKQPGFLYSLLKEFDSISASKISPNDLRRVIRALEVFIREKKLISEMQGKFTKPLPYNFLKIGITRERKELYNLIEKRVDLMIEKGLIQEVRDVLNLIRKHASDSLRPFPALQAIGYKEIASYISDLFDINEAVRLIKKRTKMYAKRQFTWFKRENNINWFDISGRFDFVKIAEEIYIFTKSKL